tara:strand:- start:576 stop:1514 length:939 start_codon:yes stop_codon:yes gene_type:complete
MGKVEFLDFWNCVDSCFSSPLGRKLIYAATDAEERILANNDRYKLGRFFGRKRVKRVLRQRALNMGWGVFGGHQITAPVHDALSVGLALAHEEHVRQLRFDMEWNQPSQDLILIDYAQKQGNLSSAPKPTPFEWMASGKNDASKASFELDLDLREHRFFSGFEQSFFLHVSVLEHFFTSLVGRDSVVHSCMNDAIVDDDVQHAEVVRVVAHASLEAFNRSEDAIYVQKAEDWNGHLINKFTRRGLGRVKVLQSILNGGQQSVFHINSPIAPFVAGTLIGMWQRAHGMRASVRLSRTGNALVLHLAEPTVDYG